MNKIRSTLVAAVALLALAGGYALLTPSRALAQSGPDQSYYGAINASAGDTSSGGVAIVATSSGVRFRVRAIVMATSSAGVVLVKSGNVQDSSRFSFYAAANTTYLITPDILGNGIAMDRGEAIVLEIASGNLSGSVVYSKD